MKKLILVTVLSAMVSHATYAQLGGLIKKAKDKVEKKEEPKESKPSNNTPATTSSSPSSQKKEEQKEDKMEGGFYKTNGTSRPIHQKYMGKIVFAHNREDIAFENENEAGFSDKFVFGENNYCRVYLDNSPSNYILQLLPGADKKEIDESATFWVHFFFDGKEIYDGEMGGNSFDPEDRQKFTTFKGMIEDKKADRSSNIFAGRYQIFLSLLNEKLSVGDHKVRLEVRPYTYKPQKIEGKTVAAGEFTLTVKPNSIDPADEDFCLRKAGFKDAKAEAAVLKQYVKEGGNKQTKHIRFTSDKWIIERHAYSGAILRRKSDAAIVSIDKDGRCVYETFIVSQEYVSGKFEDGVTISGIGSASPINIQCIK